MSYPQFSGYTLGSLVQSVADLETNLGGAITDLGVNVSSVKTEVLNIPKSAIKSIQRGVVVFGITEFIVTINHSAVNVAKSFILLHGSVYLRDGTKTATSRIDSRTSTKFVSSLCDNAFQGGEDLTRKIAWELVEYN